MPWCTVYTYRGGIHALIRARDKTIWYHHWAHGINKTPVTRAQHQSCTTEQKNTHTRQKEQKKYCTHSFCFRARSNDFWASVSVIVNVAIFLAQIFFFFFHSLDALRFASTFLFLRWFFSVHSFEKHEMAWDNQN